MSHDLDHSKISDIKFVILRLVLKNHCNAYTKDYTDYYNKRTS